MVDLDNQINLAVYLGFFSMASGNQSFKSTDRELQMFYFPIIHLI
jgi:hypothetical protein